MTGSANDREQVIFDKLRRCTLDSVWNGLTARGFGDQFIGGLRVLQPDKVMVGRALTLKVWLLSLQRRFARRHGELIAQLPPASLAHNSHARPRSEMVHRPRQARDSCRSVPHQATRTRRLH